MFTDCRSSSTCWTVGARQFIQRPRQELLSSLLSSVTGCIASTSVTDVKSAGVVRVAKPSGTQPNWSSAAAELELEMWAWIISFEIFQIVLFFKNISIPLKNKIKLWFSQVASTGKANTVRCNFCHRTVADNGTRMVCHLKHSPKCPLQVKS